MIIFPTANLVYFAVPRVGSTTFERAFRRAIPNAVILPENAKHMNVRQFESNQRARPPEWFAKNIRRMAILRDPLERLHSWYRYRRRLDQTQPNSTRGISFDTFIEGTMQPDPPSFATNVGDQWQFCQRKDGTLGITHLFDIANPQPLNAFLQDRLGQGFPGEKSNQSDPLELTLSKTMEQKLRDHRAKEYEFYEKVRQSGGHLVSRL